MVNSGIALAIAVTSGAAIGVLGGTVPSDATAFAVGALAFLVLADRPPVRAGWLLLATFLASVAHGASAADGVLTSPLRQWWRANGAVGRDAGVHLVRGRLTDDAALIEGQARLTIALESVGAIPTRGRIQVHVSGELSSRYVDEWTAGRGIVAPVLLREPPSWRNPGTASERWQQLRQRADLVGTIKSAALVEISPGRWWDEAAARARRHVRRAANRHVAPRSAQSAAIVTAILIGDRAGLADEVQQRLRAAGTYHVVAISGGNVAILAALCFAVLGVVLRSFRTVAVVTIGLVVMYGALVGDEPSVRRAITAASIYLALSVTGLRPRAVNVLAVTALVATVGDPLVVIDAGAWLSFGATLGILLGASQFTAWATASGGGPPGAGRAPASADSMARRGWLTALGLFSATVAAELTLLPISAALFSRVGVLGLVLNFVAIPAMTIVQLAGVAMTALSGWCDRGAAMAGQAAALAASALVESSRAVDAAPWLVWRAPPVPIVWTVVFYAGLGGAIVCHARSWQRRVAAAAAVLSVVVIVSAPGLPLAGPPPGRLRLTVLDVGQGDAIAVQFPDGHSLLVDAGGVAGAAVDIGDRVVTPALWALGIRRLDWLAVTHGDADHVGGMASVERDFRPREVWEGVPVPAHSGLHALRDHVHRHGGAWRQILAGHRLELGSVVLEALHPPPPDWERRRVRNDDSLVLRIRFGVVDVLLTGDAGHEFETSFVDRDPRALLRLLKVGHHGSRSSSSARFVEAVAPHMALVSVGRGNTFGHPTREVLSRLEQIDAVVFRTDLDGAIRIETDGAVVEATSMSGRHWTMSAK